MAKGDSAVPEKIEYHNCAAGEIGRRNGFRSRRPKACGFESHAAHHFISSVSAEICWNGALFFKDFYDVERNNTPSFFILDGKAVQVTDLVDLFAGAVFKYP